LSKIQEQKYTPMTPMRYMMQELDKERDNPKGYTVPPRKGIYLDEPSDKAIELIKKGKRVAVT
jgi:hypothetical protein